MTMVVEAMDGRNAMVCRYGPELRPTERVMGCCSCEVLHSFARYSAEGKVFASTSQAMHVIRSLSGHDS